MGKDKKPRVDPQNGRFVPHHSPLVDSVSQYRETPAQAVMREEMQGVQRLDGVLDEVMGSNQNPDITQTALHIIGGYDVNLTFKQWNAVQQMVEEGIRRGLQAR